VTISPQGAIDGGAQWRRVGTGVWRNSGTTETGVPVGQHTIEFKDVSGWTTPANQTVMVSNGRTATATGAYNGWFGSLCVTIGPQEAVNAGAQWRRVGTSTWRNSGFTEAGIAVGQHTIEFKDVSGWAKPDAQAVTISEGQTTTAIGTYTAPTGSLRVTISPQAAIDAGAQWRVDGGTWHASGETQTGLSVGYHTVSFSSVAGWTRPGNRTIKISMGQTATVTGTYTLQSGFSE